jgi:rare lipoprotein A (peptidoglycan hydrolase)/cell division protein FtsN
MKKMIMLVISGLFVTAVCAAQTQTSGNAPFRQEGIASWYGVEFEGRPTTSGELFDPNQFTAAHRDLPFGTLLIVTNVINGEQVVVRVNDRGPFAGNRIIDVSKAAAEKLNMLEAGTAQVVIELAPRNTVAPPPATVSQTSAGTQPSSAPPQPQTAAVTEQPETVAAPNAASVAPTSLTAQPQQAQQPALAAQPQQPQSQQPRQAQQPAARAPVTGQTTLRPPVSANTVAPAYTPQQPALAVRQPAQQPSTPSTPAASQRTTAPATQPRTQSSTQSRSQTVSPPVASFQPVPTTPRPPIPSTTSVSQPTMPSSAMAPAVSQPTQPSRSWPSYASAEVTGGPFVKGRYYRLQIGSYKAAKNAVEVFDRLSAAGLNPQWEPYTHKSLGELYRVVISNVRADDINSIAVRLGGAGFKDAIAREER